MLRTVNVAVLGALLSIGAAPRPNTLGLVDYGGGVQTLGLCPPSPNCIATSEEGNDREHYAPPLWVVVGIGPHTRADARMACT